MNIEELFEKPKAPRPPKPALFVGKTAQQAAHERENFINAIKTARKVLEARYGWTFTANGQKVLTAGSTLQDKL